ncbi:MAG: hypothetical protein CHACPFDD_02796 [Phycisphaerae bacterium]|nr:hypothetical protein [Phycisphaerae bacterium]
MLGAEIGEEVGLAVKPWADEANRGYDDYSFGGRGGLDADFLDILGGR